jgi:NADH dehydrogenase
MILVAGSTGILGGEICRQLRAAGKSVRGLVRATSNPDKVSGLQSLGVETVVGDMCDPASLDEACKGVSHVITTVSAMPFSYVPGVNDLQTTDVDGTTNLIAAAKAHNVAQFIFTSVSVDRLPESPLKSVNREVENRLKESGLTYTILRPSFFMEVWLSPAVGFDAANAKAALYGNGQNPTSWIAVQDVARFAVAALDHPVAKNATLELGGPEAICPLDVIKVFEEVSGRPFEVQLVPEQALEAQQAAATDPMQQSFSAAMRAYASGDPIEMSAMLKSFDVEPTPLKEYAKRVMTPS